MRILYMKNKKTVIFILLVVFLGMSACFGYYAFKFAKEKYHYLREHIDKIENYILFDYERNYKHYDFDYSWAEENKLVAHGMGGYDGDSYTNSLQAFEYNYSIGYRVFEVDLDLSSDHYTICSHDEDFWRSITKTGEDEEYSLENFNQKKLRGDLDSLDYKDIIDLLVKYPDAYIITDNKYSDEFNIRMQFTQFLQYAKEIGHMEAMNRLIPQIYNQRMLEYVMNIYDFKSVVYTLYQDPDWETDSMAIFCSRTGVGFITMRQNIVDPDRIAIWNRFGIKTAVHTVDDKEEAESLFNTGIDMLYSNFLLPEDFK